MKKLLLASTALIAGASAAAADITLSGYGRFGLFHAESTTVKDTTVDQRLRLIITGTAESQNGIAFTAQTRIQWDDAGATATDSVSAAAGSTGIRDAAFHAAAGGLTLSVGNVSVAEATPGFYAGALGFTTFMFVDPYYTQTYGRTDIGLTTPTSNGVVMGTYQTGPFTLRAGFSDTGTEERQQYSVAYSDNGYTVSLFHQESTTAANDVTKLYVQGAIGGATVGLFVDDSTAGNSVGLTGSMAVGAATRVTVTAVDLSTGGENIGVGINHDLGGGVSFGAAIADMNGRTTADAGVVFNF